MDRRLKLQTLLESLNPKTNVYFQAPGKEALKYPCILYQRSVTSTDFANDRPYNKRRRYQVTYISRDPDDEMIETIGELPSCIHSTHFKADGLNHDVFFLYF